MYAGRGLILQLLLQIIPFSCYQICQWDGYLSSITSCYSPPEIDCAKWMWMATQNRNVQSDLGKSAL